MSQTPLPPMPVIPVTPAYALPASRGRPGIITGVGVLSIIFAILQMGSNVGTGIFSAVSLIGAQMQKMSANLSDVSMHPYVPPGQIESSTGLDDAAVTAAVNGLSQHRALTLTRAQHLRSLMSKHGKRIFPFGSGSLTAQRVKASVSDSGQMMLSMPGKTADWFQLSTGRVEVDDTQAIFRPEGDVAVRSNDAADDRSLTESQIDALIAQVNTFTNGQRINDAQDAAIRKLLRDPNQGFISTPSMSVSVYGGQLADGGVWFVTDSAQIRLAKDGTPTLLNTTASIPGNSLLTGKPITTIWARLMIFESLASGGLAILLLVAAIMLLRGRPAGRRLHTIWACIKLPLAIIGAIFFGFTVTEWQAALSSASPAASSNLGTSAAMIAIGISLLSLAWPVIVLVVMRSRSVREYMHGVR